jgi:hypothetical protein
MLTVPSTAETLLEIAGIGEAYGIAGEWDLVDIAKVKHQDASTRART